MPSWNIHIAQTERLLEGGGVTSQVVRDQNAFLFGCLVPDIPVGYMVPGIERPIAYRVTHVAKPEFIPKPREWEFWDTYVAPLGRPRDEDGAAGRAGGVIPASSIALEVDRVNRVHYPQRFEGSPAPRRQGSPLDALVDQSSIAGSVFDLTLGAWAHLLADNIWNTRVSEYLDAIGGVPSEQFRIKKQGDFDAFGKTLAISLVPRATPRLLAVAAAFAQYPIDERSALMTIGVAHEIVRTNKVPAEPNHYRLLTDEFFAKTFAEVVARTDALVAERLLGR